MTTQSLFPEFISQADYIPLSEIVDLNYDNAFYADVRSSLLDKGSRLLVGPRGVGKTHQMRLALIEAIEDREKPFAIYASFNQYYHLEPLTKRSPNARKIFHTWMLCHLLESIQISYDSFCQGASIDVYSYLGIEAQDVLNYKSLAQTGVEPELGNISSKLNIASIIGLIRKGYDVANRKRAILLLDDAAMSLASDYLYEFFEIFQALKNHDIAPKASVYPGTTQYGPKFHARHDATFINAWLNVEDSTYKDTMRGIINSRLKGLSIASDDIDLLAYASFGVPRTFLNMLLSYHNKSKQKANKGNMVIEEQSSLIIKEFESLSLKMPQFKSVIDVGKTLINVMVSSIADENATLAGTTEKQVMVGIVRDADLSKPMIERMLSLMEEAGLIFSLHPVKHGEDREYDRFIPHYALLMRSRAFSFSRGTSHRNTVNFIERKNVQHPIRRTIKTLLSANVVNALKPNLPPCQNCHADRISEDQRFCHNCGRPLITKSIFEELLLMPIDALPLTIFLKRKITEETNLKTVSDFISLQDPASDLREAYGIGPKRSTKVVDIVNAVINGFLS